MYTQDSLELEEFSHSTKRHINITNNIFYLPHKLRNPFCAKEKSPLSKCVTLHKLQPVVGEDEEVNSEPESSCEADQEDLISYRNFNKCFTNIFLVEVPFTITILQDNEENYSEEKLYSLNKM